MVIRSMCRARQEPRLLVRAMHESKSVGQSRVLNLKGFEVNKNSRFVRSATFAAIVGLSMTLGAPAALAADTMVVAQGEGGSTAETHKANIDFSKTGSLTLYKLVGPESGTNAPGTALDPAPAGTPLDGVTFKITKLNFDLQNGDWDSFPKDASAVKDGDKTSTTSELVTGDDGKVSFTGLDLGLYLVEESDVPNGVTPGAPFLVSIPMVNVSGDAWNYDVVAYPKNSKSETAKTVNDKDKNIGDAYSYTITADAPNFREDQSLTKFEFHDTLDLRLKNPTVTEVKAGDTVLDTSDYEMTFDEATGEMKVALTSSGLAKVKSGDKMSLTFEVTRDTVGDSIDVKNDATVIFNNPNGGGDVTTDPSDEVTTAHAVLKVLKKDEAEAGAVLEGAEFELYRCTSASALDDKLTVNGQSTWTTNEQGLITIDGLQLTDFQNNAEVTNPGKYCLKETKAPAGYVLPENPVTEVNFTRADVEDTADGSAVALTAEVTNVKRDTPDLPLTGGAGVGILAAVGAAIVALGAWFARRNTKKA